MDLFFIFNLVVQFDGIGSTAKEGYARVERWHDVEFIDELFHLKISVYHLFPFALPHFSNIITQGGQLFDFIPRFFTHIVHGFVQVNRMSHRSVRKTSETSVIEASLEFVHGTSLFVVPIDAKTFCSMHQCPFTFISHVRNSG